MARNKQEEVAEEPEKKSNKATVIALFNALPEEVRDAIDNFVKGYKKTSEFANIIVDLCERHNLNKNDLGFIIKEKVKALGLRPPNLKALLLIGSEEKDTTEEGEDAEEAVEEEEATLPCIRIALDSGVIDKTEVIAGINTSKVMNVYYSEEDMSFVKVDFD